MEKIVIEMENANEEGQGHETETEGGEAVPQDVAAVTALGAETDLVADPMTDTTRGNETTIEGAGMIETAEIEGIVMIGETIEGTMTMIGIGGTTVTREIVTTADGREMNDIGTGDGIEEMIIEGVVQTIEMVIDQKEEMTANRSLIEIRRMKEEKIGNL